jgi:hypothetical protein
MNENVRYRGVVADCPIDTMVSRQDLGTGEMLSVRQPSRPANLQDPMMPPHPRSGVMSTGMSMSNLGMMQNYLDHPDNRPPEVWIRQLPPYING